MWIVLETFEDSMRCIKMAVALVRDQLSVTDSVSERRHSYVEYGNYRAGQFDHANRYCVTETIILIRQSEKVLQMREPNLR